MSQLLHNYDNSEDMAVDARAMTIFLRFLPKQLLKQNLNSSKLDLLPDYMYYTLGF